MNKPIPNKVHLLTEPDLILHRDVVKFNKLLPALLTWKIQSKEKIMRNTILLFTITMLALAGTANAQLDSLWSRTYGGEFGEYCNSIVLATDSGYVLAGSSNSFGEGRSDIWLVKTDINGDSLWSRTYGDSASDVCFSMIQTTDGGYALGGMLSFIDIQNDFENSSNMWLIKTNAEGDSLWSKRYGGNGNEVCSSIIQTADGGYALGGFTESFGNGYDDMWFVKTNADGDSIWSKTFGGQWNDDCCKIIQTLDEGYALLGHTYSFGAGGSDIWLVKTDEEGDTLWSNTFGGEDHDYCGSVVQTADSGYVISGYVNSDMWLIKTDASGDSLWCQVFETDGNVGDVIQTSDDGFIATTDHSFFGGSYTWIVRMNSIGDVLWSDTLSSGELLLIICTPDGGYALAGETSAFPDQPDMLLVKLGADTLSAPNIGGPVLIGDFILMPVYPNPFNSTTTISYGLPCPSQVSLLVYNTLGQQITTVFEGYRQAGFHSATLSASDLPSGLYFVQLKASEQVFTRKVMLIQ